MDPGQSQPKVTKANLSGIIRQINRKSPEVVTFGSLLAIYIKLFSSLITYNEYQLFENKTERLSV